MKDPKLTIALAERGDAPVLQITRNDNELFNRVDWKLATLAELGALGACAHIGKVTLMMLHTAHRDVFVPFPCLQPEESLSNPDDAVSYLLRASMCHRTRAYVSAIDALFHNSQTTLSDTLRSTWPELRARILRDYPDST